ncbi:excinuclease ABC subunit UvrA [Oligella urethralis]|uniref:excinuclease ABC subunit UvrA n=1 Tax=Oligella urethralis TaxID=90245 RepID=UPI00068DABA2|nr:excinuclease ABC subunit UvrA [Oligella urethralis]AVL70019.1 excinuclease ABC subunit A [Oligella urethralis]MDK6203394.1 excinuclease ABC subunit UvrA [Oligella urethralis]
MSHQFSADDQQFPDKSNTAIRIRGARTHNLKNIDLDLPRNKLVILTGLSGSGKSSLAFDTLYAEGQRRYVESLSTYARQFLELMDKPDVDLIEGLSPAIAIEQKSVSHNPRSTVGTITEISDYLRLLFARVGTPYCPIHKVPLQAYSVSQIVDFVLQLPAESRLMILAPVVVGPEQNLINLLHSLQAQGFIRVRLGDELYELDNLPGDLPTDFAQVDLVIDRLRVREEQKQRLADSIETALEVANERVLIVDMDQGQSHAFSRRYACPHCDYQMPRPEPKMFSFNSHEGACPSCDGLGFIEVFDPAKVIISEDLSLLNGAIKGWDRRNLFSMALLNTLATHYDFDLEKPWHELPRAIQDMILYGSGSTEIDFVYLNDKGKSTVKRHTFEGVLPNLERRWAETESTAVREELGLLRTTIPCTACHGTRLREEARFVRIGDSIEAAVSVAPVADALAPKALTAKTDTASEQPLPGYNISELSHLSLEAAQQWFEQLNLNGANSDIARPIVQAIKSRLSFLNNVGLNYLSLDRKTNTISGGEAQRIRLASQIGSGLSGVLYVLDEPSIGLHQRDNDRLIDTLIHLRNLGNTVIVVEHDEDMIRAADWVVDLGPGAGEHGGKVMASETPQQLQKDPNSLTGQYLSGAKKILVPKRRPINPLGPLPWLHLIGASGNNLKNVDLHIPLQRLVCVTGVSGSGKSTLVNDTLAAVLAHKLNRAQNEAAPYQSISGLEYLDKIITVDQSPIGRTPRSNPATYTGLFTPIRELFAGTPEARSRGYDPGRFSFNVKGGRCEHCQGDGVIKVEMHFLPDVYVPCDVCHGKRYNRETLEIRYRGLNISEVLALTVEQALAYFSAVPAIQRRLQTLYDVGLGYVRLGQSATTLSGGEAQRIKLSLELSKRSTGNTLYVLDEPTTGLHFADIELLLEVLNRLVDAGNSMVIIEHNLDLIKTADWIIDLGPEGGHGGGRIVAEGSPEEIVKNPASATGKYLAPYLKK